MEAIGIVDGSARALKDGELSACHSAISFLVRTDGMVEP